MDRLALVVAVAIVAPLNGAAATALTQNETKYLPAIAHALSVHWPDHPRRSLLAAQVRKETCIHLAHAKCFTPFAELKTSREYGFGFGQITITERFDNFKAAQSLHSSLSDWKWENRYNAANQAAAMVLMMRGRYYKYSKTKEPYAFALADYNGGGGGVASDRLVCSSTPGCNSSVWFGHVEHTSKKAKVAVSGYGQSFFQINRGYVTIILTDYYKRYMPYFGEND